MAESDLNNGCVIVTRPAHQAEPLCQALIAAGAQVIRLPLIEIKPLTLPPLDNRDNDEHFDWFIFTSPNAVHEGLAGLGKIASRLAAVGAATAKALEQAGFSDVLIPAKNYSSEGLLDCSEFQQPGGQRILLIKGRGGRQLLSEELRARGAEVSERLVYERQKLSPEPERVRDAVKQANSIIVTSQEILERLMHCCPDDSLAALLNLQLVVPSERVVKRARGLGFKNIDCVGSPLTETAMLQAVQGL